MNNTSEKKGNTEGYEAVNIIPLNPQQSKTSCHYLITSSPSKRKGDKRMPKKEQYLSFDEMTEYLKSDKAKKKKLPRDEAFYEPGFGWVEPRA
jgi:hypothetical protein